MLDIQIPTLCIKLLRLGSMTYQLICMAVCICQQHLFSVDTVLFDGQNSKLFKILTHRL